MNNYLSTLLVIQDTVSTAAPKDNSGFWVLVVTLLMGAIVVGRVFWPLVSNESIFSKEKVSPYAEAESNPNSQTFTPMQALVVSFGLSILEVIIFVYHSLAGQPVIHSSNDEPYRAGPLFLLSLFDIVAIFIYTAISKEEFEGLRDFKFTLKVWLTVVFAPPVIFLMIYHKSIANLEAGFYLYWKIAIMVHGAGVATFGALVLAVSHYTKKTWRLPKKRIHIFVVAEAVMLPSMFLLAAIMHYGWGWVLAWLIYAFTMGLAIMYYDMNHTVYSDETYYIAEVIDDTRVVDFKVEDVSHVIDHE